MKYSTFFYVKRMAKLGEYKPLPSQTGSGLCHVERHLPRHKQLISRARQRWVKFWSTAVSGTIIIITELSRLVFPVMCHSHNDYWRPHPLLSALSVGCASVEADVWLSPDGEDLLVGHDKQSLSSSRTLRLLYLDPLLQILNSMNRPPDTTLILFIDVKDDPVKTWPLSFWAGPITIVGTGNIVQRRDINIGPDLKEWQQRHDAFLHAPLHLLTETGFSQSGEFYCPDEFENDKAIGSARTGFSGQQMETLRN
ncbi:uncharacterized protein BKA55DRAFT_667155 [Fusarium redolens]|uniref:Altered inheritance of mitochondria protein 6 n=1 Tax=Fusarium redolens TaxID=48865 RepID=A0A9P9JVC1_FUSRE|nr:uncharacterized protein BKA55DRAFT_667155 [Fusarium redolens]KAH7233745.1 hypothetical protein BKA55DRAFT_667155 [Fusarium redolens]